MRGPSERGGYWLWEDAADGVEVRFVGCGPSRPLSEALAAVGVPAAAAWARQVHSARVLPVVEPGLSGEGDALVTRRAETPLVVVTADCVPVLLAGDGEVAAVHAGWRGIAGGVVGGTVAALDGDAAGLTAWIGPAIGPCCYEVDDDVAARVVAVSDPSVARLGPAGKPHLDLPAAVAAQLSAAGVGELRRVSACTRCQPARLFSYRRDGKRAGRNLALVWRTGDAPVRHEDRGRTP